MSEPAKFSLFKRSNNVYYVIVEQDGHRRWKSTGCSRKSDALKALTQFQTLMRGKSRTVSLSLFSKEYLEYARATHARGTVDIARLVLGHLQQLSQDDLLTAITAQHLDRYKSKRLGEVSPVSVNVELRSLRSIMNVALRWGYIEKNPFAGMKQVAVPDVPPLYLSKADFDKLLGVIRENWLREIVIFAVLTGLRRGEIINLRWQDVDLSRTLIRIQSNGSFRTKKGKRRSIPLGSVVLNLLKSKSVKSESEYLFTRQGRQIAEDWLTHRFKHYVCEAKLPTSLHFHSLRHTFASWLVQDGVSLYEVQKLLGHSSIAVTEIYSHLQPEQLHETVNRLKIEMN